MEFLQGDILIVQTGWTDAWDALSEREKRALPEKWATGGSIGVLTNEDMARWHWDQGFSAVVTDW